MKPTDQKFVFWRISKNGVFPTDYWRVLGITKNESLVVDGRYGKLWIKKEFYDSKDSPIWFISSGKDYGYIIRKATDVMDIEKIVANIKTFYPFDYKRVS